MLLRDVQGVAGRVVALRLGHAMFLSGAARQQVPGCTSCLDHQPRFFVSVCAHQVRAALRGETGQGDRQGLNCLGGVGHVLSSGG